MSHTQPCPQCGTLFPAPVGRRARQRYCSTRCRKAAWRHRRAASQRTSNPGDVPDRVAVPTASRDADADIVHDDATAAPAAGSTQRCPHCRRPITVIAVAVPPTAAHVRPPEVIPTTPD
ncbi:MAG: hypothetical protein ACRDQA_19850 [Nocardioidaceae bacterium]